MQGHVDAVGEIVTPVPDLHVRVGEELMTYLVEKGSVTVDGISLTVVDVLPDGFTVAIIPHTAAVTTLGTRQPGDLVNIEVDVIAKYVERMVRPFVHAGRGASPDRPDAFASVGPDAFASNGPGAFPPNGLDVRFPGEAD